MDQLNEGQKEAIAENMKERIYSTITLIAVLTALWQSNAEHSTAGDVAVIFGSVVALWLATMISIRVSYRAVHGKPISLNLYRKALFTASGLLVPAIVPMIIVIFSGVTHWYSLKTALMASIIASLLFLFGISFGAARKIYDSFWRLLLVSLFEMLVGVGVIALKLAVGE